ncbi:MAG TPA: AAA family ATPase, partial [Microthrixaceae bacterium]|nr:AAA family ATPase [Microthrixaceae bacterium]
MGPYQRRIIDDELDELFTQLPAILLDGPKGVGKTSTAEQRCVTVRRLDVEAERQVVA